MKERDTDRAWKEYQNANRGLFPRSDTQENTLYRTLYAHALRVCYTEFHQHRPDIASDACWKAFKNLGGFKGKSKFSTWFHRIVLNTVASVRRTDARLAEVGLDAVGEQGENANLDGAQLYRELEERLSPEERVLWELKLKGVTEGAVAKLLGLSEAGVRSRWFRLRKKLGKLIS